ncbi:MAG: lipopolysaccharide biosynthesis protein [Arachnia sp.]
MSDLTPSPRSRISRLLSGAVSRILSGSVLGQGVLVLVSPLLTRIYSPQDFGALATFTAIVTVMGGLSSLSWERAVAIPRSDRQGRSLVLLALGSSFTISVACCVPIFVWRRELDALLGVSLFEPFWWLVPCTMAVLGLQASVTAWLVRKKRYSSIALRNGVQGIAQSISSVGLGLAGLTPFGLLSGMAIGRFASVLGVVRWRSLPSSRLPERRLVMATASRFRRFPLVATWSRAVNVLGLQLPPLLIVAIYGVAEAGLYALTLRVLAVPVGVVVNAVSQYFEAAFAGQFRERRPGLAKFTLKICSRLLLVALVPSVVILIAGEWVFGWAFGSGWDVAGVYAQITVLMYVAQFAVSPISRGLLILERQGLQLAWDATRAVVCIAAVVVPFLVSSGQPSLGQTLVWFTVSQILLYGVLLLISTRAMHRAEAKWTT